MKRLFTILLSTFSLTGFSQNWNEIIKAVAADRGANDSFGYSVSISGNRAIVGAYGEDEDATGGNTYLSAGSAYVFELSGGVWSQTAKLVASDRLNVDYFGCSVSISGDKVIVGACQEDEDATGSNTLTSAGSVYIFELSGGIWSQTAKLVASDRGSNDFFGSSVSISGDKVIVGADSENEDVTGGNTLIDAGSAYIFELSGGVWSETTKLVASDRGSVDNFGFSVSISGNKAIIGAYQEDEDTTGGNTYLSAGSAYVFELNGGIWSETSKLVASNRGSNDFFGSSVSISGNKIIIGAYGSDVDRGSAYIFELSGGVWSETTELVASDRSQDDQFGRSVSISGNKVIVGAFGEDDDVLNFNPLSSAGSAYIFELSGGIWSETTKLVASDRGAGDSFGFSASISGDIAIIGAFGEDEDPLGLNTFASAGSTYIFELCVNTAGTQTVTTCDSYTWINGSTYTSSITTTHTLTNSAGCDSVVTLNLTINTVNVTTTLTGNSISANATGVSYQWIDCDNGNIAIPSQTNQTYTATTNGSYAVIVNNGNCIDTSTCINIVGLGISELDKDNLKLYPNPTTGNIIIDLHELENVNVTIINSLGEMVYENSNITQNKLAISLTGFSNGIYFIKVQNGNEFYTQKIIKQ